MRSPEIESKRNVPRLSELKKSLTEGRTEDGARGEAGVEEGEGREKESDGVEAFKPARCIL